MTTQLANLRGRARFACALTALLMAAQTIHAASKDKGPFFDRAPYVNPLIVRELVTWISDSDDVVVAIDLDRAQDSNQFHDHTDRKSGEFAATECEVKSISGEYISTENFFYRYVGRTDSGVILLYTRSDSGGSGAWINLLFLVIEHDFGLKIDRESGKADTTRPRRLIKKLDDIFLGDRWYGQLKVEGKKVFIGRDHGRYSADAGSDEPYGEESWRNDPNDWEQVIEVEFPGPFLFPGPTSAAQ